MRPAITHPNSSDRNLLKLQKIVGLEEKLQNIKSYHRAKGLCFKCGDKWSPNHKCSNTVSLNLVEELWQLLSEEEDTQSPDQARHNTDSGEDLMELSLSAIEGTTYVRL